MVLPPVLKNRFDMSFSEYHNTVSGTLQKALRIFMEEGEWERHIRKTRLNSRKKHDILESALESGLGDGFRVTGKDAGVHMIIESSELTAEEKDAVSHRGAALRKLKAALRETLEGAKEC